MVLATLAKTLIFQRFQDVYDNFDIAYSIRCVCL